MYAYAGHDHWTLIGVMYTANESYPQAPPDPGGPITRWHYHDKSGGQNLMMHIFFVPGNDLAHAYAAEMTTDSVRTDHPDIERLLWTPRHSLWRWPLAAASATAALAHIPVIGSHLRQAPYMGEEFIVLTAACLLLATAALICDSIAVYALTVLTCGLAILGYILTRTISFPQLSDDVGNWLEPLGVVSVLAEALAVIAASRALRDHSTSQSRIRV